MYYYEVLVAHLYANNKYTYVSDHQISDNTIVSIEFSKKIVLGIVISQTQVYDNAKKIEQIFSYSININDLKFLNFFSQYYLTTLGSALDLSLPTAILKKEPLPMLFEKNDTWIVLDKLFKQGIKRSSILKNKIYKDEFVADKFVQLDANQLECMQNIKNMNNGVCLLEGATGSGKTIVALESIAHMKGKILIITPEVNLSKSWAKVIARRFGKPAYIFHHKMNDLYKASFFKWANSDEPGFIVGARSALFIPYKNLKAIIVDEEHSSSLKQERYPRYQARDMAVLKAAVEKIPCILMSATPSLETVYNVEQNKYKHFKLKRKPKLGSAKVEVVKQEKFQMLSPKVIAEIEQNIKEKKQTLLFLNRKGYAPYCTCSLCFNVLKCVGCDLAKIYYQNNYVVCHKCGCSEILPAFCGSCQQTTTWKFYGIGIEKLSEYVDELFPSVQKRTLTSDTSQCEEYLEEIYENKVNIIIATQVLAQGHDFKNISLVVIVDADMGLNSPDFRSSEKMYQLWQQLRGRSNRHEVAGKMIIQALDENNKFINLFKQEDIYKTLKLEREEGNWPPFTRCAFLIFKSKKPDALKKMFSSNALKEFNKQYEIYGPYYVGRLHFVAEWRYLIKISKTLNISKVIAELQKNLPKISGISKEIEIDPYNFL